MRFFLSGASECEFDRLGRINISEPLLKYASLNRECVIIGVNERLEIWNKDLWDNFVLENEKNFSSIADHLFETNV